MPVSRSRQRLGVSARASIKRKAGEQPEEEAEEEAEEVEKVGEDDSEEDEVMTMMV
jgi:hypothetical protein